MALAACLFLLALAPRTTRAQEEERDEGTRFFALPMVRETREQSAVAEEHLAAGRYAEAVQVLQGILEQHASEVLEPERAGTDARSTYPGAAEWALRRLYSLPEEARAQYRARYEGRALEALARARRASDRFALVAIPRKWPLAFAAIEAWWALGDLEYECGEYEPAELAWRRALALAKDLGRTAPAPSPAREAWLAERGRTAGTPEAKPPTLPRGDAVPWTTPLDLTPFAQRASTMIGRNLQPLAVDDTVYVSTTLRLYALDAYSGELRWRAGPPAGWSRLPPGMDARLFEGLNLNQLFLAPVVGNGIALAALQEPFTENESDDWQGITIMTAIPERRLHAFDLASGRELWNHAPPLSFDGLRFRWDGGGSYAQRMMIAGSPVVAGTRVLVPCYRMQGRIDYHVACYELASGALLWNTPVISGQRERNMFGRSVSEFCASPLLVAGERVIAQTELGTLAGLDLFTGRILWQTTYRQIPLPKTRNYNAPPRPVTWLLAPPVVVGDLLVATPSDSSEVVALRLADGAKLWEYAEGALQELHRPTRMVGFNLLVGADADTLYLSGLKLSALQKPGGLASAAPFVARWTEVLDRPDSSPRAVRLGDVILAPSPLQRSAFGLRTGERIPALSGTWGRGEGGTVFAREGALFSLSQSALSGYFDWQAQLDRARRLALPGAGPSELRAAAQLFLRRGKLALEEESPEAALQVLREAQALFTRLPAEARAADPEGELECTRTLAEVLTRLQRLDEALAVLRAARALAPGGRERAMLLFQEERVLRGRPERLAVLDTLEREFGELSLANEMRDQAVRAWLERVEEGSIEVLDEPLPAGLWAALERGLAAGEGGDYARALTDLHQVLARAGSRELARGRSLASLIRHEIAGLLRDPRGRAAFAPFEAEAGAALETARASGDERALAALVERWPQAQAATQALALLLEHAVARRDVRAVVALVMESLARDGDARHETELLLRLGRVLGEQGNSALEHGLIARLARLDPTRISPLPEHRGLTLAALAAENARGEAEVPVSSARFEAGIASSGKFDAGALEFLGTLRPLVQPESAPRELHLYARKDALYAYASSDPGTSAWEHALQQPLEAGRETCAFPAGSIVLATREGLLALDEHGLERWTRTLARDPVRFLSHADGVLVARSRANLVSACESSQGIPLWERALGPGDWSEPILGAGHAAFIGTAPGSAPRVLVFDLFRGTTTADFRLSSADPRALSSDAAWIGAEHLIVPTFRPRPAGLVAYELDGGRRVWSIEFGPEEEFHALARFGARTFPVALAAGREGSASNGGLYELDERVGSLRRIVPLKPQERVMGLESGRAIEIETPYLFAFTYSESERSVPIRAVHLSLGLQWTWSLPIGAQEVYEGRNLPLPAVSSQCVAIAYQTRRAGNPQGHEAAIVILDKRAGRKVDTLNPCPALAQASRLELRGLGEVLFVLGGSSSLRGAGLEILEQKR